MLGKKPWVSGCWRSITGALVPRSTMVPETRTTQGSPAWGCSWHVTFPPRRKMEHLPGDQGRDWLQKIWQPGTTGLPTGHPGICRTRRMGRICMRLASGLVSGCPGAAFLSSAGTRFPEMPHTQGGQGSWEAGSWQMPMWEYLDPLISASRSLFSPSSLSLSCQLAQAS